MFKFLESLIRGTRAHKAITPPSGLLSFYWHFIGQTPWPYMAMVVTSLCVALADMCIPVFIGKLVALMAAPDRAAALTAQTPVLSVDDVGGVDRAAIAAIRRYCRYVTMH